MLTETRIYSKRHWFHTGMASVWNISNTLNIQCIVYWNTEKWGFQIQLQLNNFFLSSSRRESCGVTFHNSKWRTHPSLTSDACILQLGVRRCLGICALSFGVWILTRVLWNFVGAVFSATDGRPTTRCRMDLGSFHLPLTNIFETPRAELSTLVHTEQIHATYTSKMLIRFSMVMPPYLISKSFHSRHCDFACRCNWLMYTVA